MESPIYLPPGRPKDFYSGFLQLSPFFLQLEAPRSNPIFLCSLRKHHFPTSGNTPKPAAQWCEARALTN